MATFEITAPDGRKFRVTAPDGASQDQILAYVQENAAKAAPPAKRDFGPQGPGGLQDAIVQGMTFGLSDEMGGLAAAAGPFLRKVGKGIGLPVNYEDGEASRAWDRGVTQERNRIADYKERNPVLGTGAEILGGFLGAAPRAVLGGGGIVNTARQTPEVQSTAQAIYQSAKSGATGGAIAGFGSAEGGLENRLEGAATGGALGGAIGGAVPAIANVAGRFGGRIMDGMGLRNPQAAGDRQLLRAFERDAAGGGPSLEEVYGRSMSNVGKNTRPEFLPDMAGENVKRLAAMTTQTPGAARQAAQTAIEQRTAGQADRISDDVARFVSGNADFHGTVDSLSKARAAASRPLYEQALSRNAWSPRVDDFIKDPVAKQGLARGLQIQRLESVARGEPFNPQQMGVTFNEAGEPALVGRPNMRVLDMVKSGLDDILEGYRDGVTGRLNLDRTGKAIDEFRRSYIGVLDDLNPDYKAARAAWAGPSQALDAMSRGRNIFRPDSEVTAQIVKNMTAADKEFFLVGVARAIKERIEKTGDARNAVNSFFANQSAREKIRAAFPDEKSFREFAGLMQRETDMFRGQAQYAPRAGSPTARNTADAADAGIDPAGDVLGALMTGSPMGALRSGAQGLMRRAQGMNSSTADYLGPILFNSRQEENAAQLARLLASRQQGQRQLGQSQALARALLGGTGIAAGAQTD